MDASGLGSNSKRCDRCRKADAECNYAASRPVGRPKAAHGRRSSRSPKSPPPAPASRRASTTTTTTTTTTTDTQPQPQPQPQIYLDDDYFNTLLLAAETPAMTETDAAMLDAHGFDLFYHDPVPSPGEHHHHQSDSTSASVAADHQQHQPDPLLTPPSSSSRSFPPFATASSTPSHTSSISSSTSSSSVPTRPHTAAVDRRRAMQHLSDLGLRLYTQLAAHQDGGACADNPDVGALAGDVLRSSNDYLATISLFSSQHQQHQQDRHGHGHLDMATAFQLLIPYVRLVQLHDVLLEAMLLRLSSSSSSATTPPDSTISRRCSESSGFPDVWVGGVCVVAADNSNGQGGGQGGVFGARLLLQMCLCVLGEIESVLGLPGEARIVEGAGDYWGPNGGGGGGAARGDEEDVGAGGLLPQAVSPRLLRTVLDERYGGGGGAPSGGVDVRATRDRIAGVRRLLRR
ncbi:hypothetical protein SLS55_009723 [Diplodia seriata]|uniref:Uncharacterized protein n=1 Tax=Diplodia seriata TaxID=420778 RepID=A0ABR3C3I5_9PEZI